MTLGAGLGCRVVEVDESAHGINVWLLGGQGYGSPHWLTWKQIHEHDGRELKGERSTPVVFWKQLEVASEDG
jgi:antirestriction protein ArdC